MTAASFDPMAAPSRVTITEVVLRDGLQGIDQVIPTATKLELLNEILAAGIRSAEIGSFVNPRALPQMADAELLFRDLPEAPDRQFIALVVNLRGVERAIESQARHVRVALSASEGHSRSNTNCTVAEGIDATRAAVERLRAAGDIGVSAGLAVAFVCPFDGVVPLDDLVRVVRDLVAMGLEEIVLGDTLGRADPRQIERTLQALQGSFPATTFSLHLHDTYGMGMANVVAGLEQGVDRFDAALGGIGGCPYAPGATGNIATEDLVFMLDSMGIDTGVDLNGLRGAAARLGRAIDSPIESAVARALRWMPTDVSIGGPT